MYDLDRKMLNWKADKKELLVEIFAVFFPAAITALALIYAALYFFVDQNQLNEFMLPLSLAVIVLMIIPICSSARVPAPTKVQGESQER
ncbi:MAG: hypothetical protein KUG55_02600 [Cycloclasticus sp.]|jgi:hypothetical protein|nr:hypothetical protein [Cycloclasticus sp.]MDF1690667.1 hypothetical protein [Cycloclasticus sp.]